LEKQIFFIMKKSSATTKSNMPGTNAVKSGQRFKSVATRRSGGGSSNELGAPTSKIRTAPKKSSAGGLRHQAGSANPASKKP